MILRSGNVEWIQRKTEEMKRRHQNRNASPDPGVCHVTAWLVGLEKEHRRAMSASCDPVSWPRNTDGDQGRCWKGRKPQSTYCSPSSRALWGFIECFRATWMPEIEIGIYPNTNKQPQPLSPLVFSSPESTAPIWKWVDSRKKISGSSKVVENREKGRERRVNMERNIDLRGMSPRNTWRVWGN